MIIKIGQRGTDAGGLVRYLANTEQVDGHKHRNHHTNPKVVSGSLACEGPLDPGLVAQLSADLNAPHLMHPGSRPKDGKSIWHCAISLKADEGVLPEATWKAIADDFMKDMGFENPSKSRARWVAVHHGQNAKGGDHIHIAASVIREDGTKVSVWKDMPRAQAIAKELEVKYGLAITAGRHTETGQHGYTQADGAIAEQLGKEPNRLLLERKIRAAALGAQTEGEFVLGLQRHGLEFKPFRQNGKVLGYSVALPAAQTGGKVYWWAGGKVAPDLSLPRLRQHWTGQFSAPKPTVLKATSELRRLQSQIPKMTPQQLADTGHQLSGALSAASLATEKTPGDLAVAARKAAGPAATRTYTWAPKRPALSAGLLMLAVTSDNDIVKTSIVIQQLMATARALHDARQAKALTARQQPRGKAPSMDTNPAEELTEAVTTVGVVTAALAIEMHARNQEAEAKNTQSETPVAAGPDTEGRMPGEDGYVPPVNRHPSQWVTGDAPLTKAQQYTLAKRGVDTAGLSKAEASLLISGDRRGGVAVQERTNTSTKQQPLTPTPQGAKTAAQQGPKNAPKR